MVFLAIEGSLAVDANGGVFKPVLNMNKNRKANSCLWDAASSKKEIRVRVSDALL